MLSSPAMDNLSVSLTTHVDILVLSPISLVLFLWLHGLESTSLHRLGIELEFAL